MLSPTDLERLIAVKRREIEKEKMLLGLVTPDQTPKNESNKENYTNNTTIEKQLNNARNRKKSVTLCENLKEENGEESLYDLKENIPADLDRYIRRHLGLPVMLKTGEYSPNNPLLRGARGVAGAGDVFIGLGDYEERKKSLRRLRQQEYKDYLDQQAKKKREEKEKAEREQRLEEDRERQRLEEVRERDRLQDEGRRSLEATRVETGIQCNSEVKRPTSVAVQTDDADLFDLSGEIAPQLTQAERELSPRTVREDERPLRPARRRSHGDHGREAHSLPLCDYRTAKVARESCRDKLMSDLRHTYMPSIFDADAIQMRNIKTEQDAAERRQYYQQELKNQIQEQQRIREERKVREKMLEQAEMRRLEEQLRLLTVAREGEIGKHDRLTAAIAENTENYNIKRIALQKEIDRENRNYRTRTANIRPTHTSKSDDAHNVASKLPFYYKSTADEVCTRDTNTARAPFSTNIPETSIFAPNYDVDSYLRRNLNPSKETLSNRPDGLSYAPKSDYKTNSGHPIKASLESRDTDVDARRFSRGSDTEKRYSFAPEYNERNMDSLQVQNPKLSSYEPSFLRKDAKLMRNAMEETLPIPVLRHSPRVSSDVSAKDAKCGVSDAMKIVDDKWKVPVVQKNILKSLPNTDGKNVNILTQLGSIRRQLQLEQLKLDNMLGNEGAE